MFWFLVACTPPDAPIAPDPPEVVVDVETGAPDSEVETGLDESRPDSDPLNCYGVVEGDHVVGTETELLDLEGIVWIDGSLTLMSLDDIGNLSSLRCLERVSGNLVIQQNANFRNLLGLDALRQVDGSVSIKYNPELLHTDHLSSLEQIGSHLMVSDNDAMTSLSLPALTQVEINTYIDDLPALEVLSMPALETANQFDAEGAPAFEFDLSRLEGASVQLYDLEIQDLSGLASLESGSLHLYDLPELSSAAGLSDDASFTYVQIAKTPKLTSLEGLAELTVSHSLTLRELPIQDLVGLHVTPNTGLNLYTLLELASLEGLEDVAVLSTLSISGCTALGDLDGLDALETLGSLDVEHSSVTSLEGMPNLVELSALTLEDNAPLSLAPLGDVALSYLGVIDQEVTGDLAGESFDSLSLSNASGSLSWTAETGNRVGISASDIEVDLSALKTATSSLTLDEVSAWPDLSSLDTVGTLTVQDSPDLTEVTLPALRIAGELTLESLDAVEVVDLGALERATSVDVTGLDVVTGLDLGSLHKTDSVEIRNAFELTDLDLGSLTETGSLNLTSLWALTDLSGLAIEEVDSLTLYSLIALTSVTGLEQLTSIDGKLYIRGLDALEDFEGMGAVEMETFELRESGMTSLDGLEGISVSGDVTVSSNDALLRVDGLSGLTQTDDLNFSSCDALQTIEGLDELTQVGSLTVYNNPELTSIDGLFGLTTVDRQFKIKDNTQLPTADAEALRDSIATIGSTITISGNGS